MPPGPSLLAKEGLGKGQQRGCPGTALSIAAGFGSPGERLQCRRIFGEVGVLVELGIPLLQPASQGDEGREWGQAGMRRVLGAGRARGRSPGSIATGTRHVMESFPPACFAWP